jgi:hypothetical protein
VVHKPHKRRSKSWKAGLDASLLNDVAAIREAGKKRGQKLGYGQAISQLKKEKPEKWTQSEPNLRTREREARRRHQKRVQRMMDDPNSLAVQLLNDLKNDEKG